MEEIVATPVNEVLRRIGLPPVQIPSKPDANATQLPQTPRGVPQAPQVPGFDVQALLKPMTELLSTFGSGKFGGSGGGGTDPTQVLSGVSSSVEKAMSTAMSAIGSLGSAWQGTAATAATGKATQAVGSSGLVAEQGSEITAATQAAAVSVAQGEAELEAIIDSFLSVVAAVGPALWLPPGQAVVVAAAQEHLTHALEVVSRVRSELSGHTAQVAAAGKKVPVTNAPSSAAMTAAVSAATAAAGAVTPIVSAVLSGVTGAVKGVGDGVTNAVKTAAGAATSAVEAVAKATDSATDDATKTPASTNSDTTTTSQPTAQQLAAYHAATQAANGNTGARGGVATTVGGSQLSVAALAAARTPSLADAGARTLPTAAEALPASAARSGGSSMVPLGAMGAAARASDNGQHSIPDFLVTARNGEVAVGELPVVGPQVVGEADVSSVELAAPDIEFRL